MANDLFDSLRTYINKVSVNEKSAAEIANSVNAWVRESGEAVKQKIEEEVESTVLRMGFVKRAEFEALAAEVAKLGGKPVAAKSSSTKKAGTAKKASAKKSPTKKASSSKASAKKSATKSPAVKKTTAKKSPVKKATVKKSVAKKASK
jgi:BMFP domain-containing protein YqiC